MGNLANESKIQKLWEQNGRVEAAEAYINHCIDEEFISCVDGRLILRMLGKPVEELPEETEDLGIDFEDFE